ncbi:MAG: hypothetical protein J0I20_27165 [Chloroflexi bacterium]|nr:hypothetical protein [Chloroflexota bacterium]OJV98358.1 MAG: hypothetical protein BGO39_16425 [Chloroflexi bacterium 54-19]
MTEYRGEGKEDRTLDEGEELTGLEYEATRRPLSAEEQQRLAQLRQNSEKIARTEQEKAVESELTDSTTVSGDDSP